MPDNTEHSPTPWYIRDGVVVTSEPADRDGKFVGDCPLLSTCPRQSANFQYVVRCVNAHDTLVAALESGISAIESLVSLGRVPANNAGLRDMRAALASAKGA